MPMGMFVSSFSSTALARDPNISKSESDADSPGLPVFGLRPLPNQRSLSYTSPS